MEKETLQTREEREREEEKNQQCDDKTLTWKTRRQKDTSQSVSA